MLFRPDEIGDLSIRLFELWGAPSAHARLVVDHLVEGSLMGIPSHGVLRIPDYLGPGQGASRGPVTVPGGSVDPSRHPTHPGTDHAFGPARRQRRVWAGRDLCRSRHGGRLAGRYGVATVSIRNQGHWPARRVRGRDRAPKGYVALGFCSGPRWAHWVSPFGAREGRFATNPIAYAYPTTTTGLRRLLDERDHRGRDPLPLQEWTAAPDRRAP